MKQLWIASLFVSLALQLACTKKSETTTQAAREPERVESTEPTTSTERTTTEQSGSLTRSQFTPEMARAEVEKARRNGETVGGSVDDAWIHSKIVSQVVGDKDSTDRKIHIDVDNGVVTLRGTVDSMQQKEEAERIAKETEGVKRVNNRLTVKK
jgi:hyperosmotically inducible periplasmic protein